MGCEKFFLFLLFFPFARDFFLEILDGLEVLEALEALDILEILEILERLDFLVSRIISFSPISFFSAFAIVSQQFLCFFFCLLFHAGGDDVAHRIYCHCHHRNVIH